MRDKFGLQRVINKLIENGAEFRTRSYSGRAMFGASCLAVECDQPLRALQQIAHEAGEKHVEMPDDVRQDSMGLEYVIYWPTVSFVDDEEVA